MKLSELGKMPKAAVIRFTGEPEETNLSTSTGELYYAWSLKDPIVVRCSVDADIIPVETDVLYIRKSDLDSDAWLQDEEDPSLVYAKDWVADFSKGHEISIYQPTTIAAWLKEDRMARGIIRTKGINDGIRAKAAELKALRDKKS